MPARARARGLLSPFQYPVEIPGWQQHYCARLELIPTPRSRPVDDMDSCLLKDKMKSVDMDRLLKRPNEGFSGARRSHEISRGRCSHHASTIRETDQAEQRRDSALSPMAVTRAHERPCGSVTHYQRCLN